MKDLRNDVIKIVCDCGARLDAVRVHTLQLYIDGGLPFAGNMFPGGGVVGGWPPTPMAHRTGTSHGSGEAWNTEHSSITYRCRRPLCGHNHQIRQDRLDKALRSALASGRTRLEFGVDL